MVNMKLPGKRKEGRPPRRFRDILKEDVQEVHVKEDDPRDRMRLNETIYPKGIC